MKKILFVILSLLIMTACAPKEVSVLESNSQDLITYNDIDEEEVSELWDEIDGYWIMPPLFYDTYIHFFIKDEKVNIGFGRFDNEINIDETKINSISLISDYEVLINLDYPTPDLGNDTNIDIYLKTDHLVGASSLSIKFSANESGFGKLDDRYAYMEYLYYNDYQTAYEAWQKDN
ncbi:MAG: membrane lipoprotein lipid attachment site-containing protein [Erysipelotrichaceae bacterium]|nr:membrane lipoprotein lipid attachment site-containing protein [Erysipelotrichaceae bacterium]